MTGKNIDYVEKVKRANSFYQKLTHLKVFGSPNVGKKIDALKAIAYFNFQCHSGRFTSRFIDDQINRLTQHFAPAETNVNAESKHVLFIARELSKTGGHTRLIENIAKFEKNNGKLAIVLVTDQVQNDIPERAKEGIFSDVISLASYQKSEKVSVIRSFFSKCCKIYNVQHPYDILPSIALNTPNRPQVIYVNHADHVFWTGASFCDSILNIRPYAENLTKMRRSANAKSILLPIRLDLSRKLMKRDEAKKLLQVSDKKVFVTVSSVEKIFPDHNHNLFGVITKILATYTDAVYFLVGVTSEQYVNITGSSPPSRLHLLGLVENPNVYQCAADVYLEGMPYNSLTALLEAIYAGAYPILMWQPYHVNVNMETELYIQNVVQHSSDELAYFQEIDFALNQSNAVEVSQRVKKMQEYMRFYNSDDYWNNCLSVDPIKADGETQGIVEFDTSIVDIRIHEWWENVWRMKKVSVYFETIRLAANVMTLRESVQLWFSYVLNNDNLGLSKRMKMLAVILFRKFFAAPEL